MGKTHPIELRSRVVGFVEEGRGHREAARHFRVSPSFVNDMVKLKRESGGLAPLPQGHRGGGKLAPFADWLRDRLSGKPDLTLDKISAEFQTAHGLCVYRGSVGRGGTGSASAIKKRCSPLSSCALMWLRPGGSG